MNRIRNKAWIGAALATALLAPLAPQAMAADVGVSVSIGQPGFYGQIDIGNYPRPQVIYEQPVIIQRAPVAYGPVYLRVPPGHEKNWGKHCAKYGACGRPVYFVRDSWYNEVYVPAYRSRHDGGRDYHDGRRDHHDDHRGPGKGHGNKGHGNGKGNGNGKGRD